MIEKLKEVLHQLTYSIEVISHYCHSRQSCDKCLIKGWCKEQRKKCPEEWRSKYANKENQENT